MECASQGDVVVLEALNETGKWLGVGIANLINVLNPELVVLGGPISQAYDLVIPSIENEVHKRALPWQRKNCLIKPARYGEDACLIWCNSNGNLESP